MRLDLTGRTAIVTGAARGIGRTIADRLSDAGASVVGIDVSLPDDGNTSAIDFQSIDITDETAVQKLADQIDKPVSILVNNAGITRDRTLLKMRKSAAKELGRKGITVNAVAPGMVMTDMARALPREILDRALAETALNKLADPEDIANAVVFLASDAARMITGQVINVDSGQLM